MLGVRHVVFRGESPAKVQPKFQSPDYWVLENRSALPRVFIPHRVDFERDDLQRLKRLGSEQFNPAEVAYVETPLDLPPDCQGSAAIIEETPTRIRISATMQTSGLLVLSDFWNKGWQCYVNGKPVPTLRTNHAVRGVVIQTGTSTVEFRYESATVALAFKLAAFAIAFLLAWLGIAAWRSQIGWRNNQGSQTLRDGGLSDFRAPNE